MSWHFSRVLGEAYLGANSLDGEQSAPLNGTDTHGTFWSPDKMTDFSRLSRSGATFAPLTADLGAGLLTWFQAASRARTSASQGKGLDSAASGLAFGQKCGELLARFDHDSSSWKTPQCSLLEDSEQSFQTFPKWGSMQNGACWEQIPLVLTTDEKEFGYLPTPTASDQYNGNKIGITYKNKRFIRKSQTTGTEFGAKLTDFYQLTNGRNLHPTFAEWMMNWPLGWTDLKPLETDKYPYVQQPLGTYLKED